MHLYGQQTQVIHTHNCFTTGFFSAIPDVYGALCLVLPCTAPFDVSESLTTALARAMYAIRRWQGRQAREAHLHPTGKPLRHVLQPEVVVHFEAAGAHRARQRKVLILHTELCRIHLAKTATFDTRYESEMYASRLCAYSSRMQGLQVSSGADSPFCTIREVKTRVCSKRRRSYACFVLRCFPSVMPLRP